MKDPEIERIVSKTFSELSGLPLEAILRESNARVAAHIKSKKEGGPQNTTNGGSQTIKPVVETIEYQIPQVLYGPPPAPAETEITGRSR